MTVLATANPNPEYIYFRNLKEITLQAIISNDHVSFYEVGPGRYVPVKEEIIQQLFPQECMLHDMPFTVTGNEDFYAVIMRADPGYTSQFEKLKEKNRPIMTRTKKAIFKRTK